ncbi:MAG: hypothetical protein K2Y32_08800 [Candidatus Obscuribacterales bacterium]|nr:hypothetical protein [Candidatus Obscuribacterales bacterium]
MDKEQALFAVSEQGSALIEKLVLQELKEFEHLKVLTTLRKSNKLSAGEAAAVLEIALARQKAIKSGKFIQAAKMFFTRDALEQASGEKITAHRRKRFQTLADSLGEDAAIVDFCCGIGGDSLALCPVGQVTGIDLNEARLVLAKANAEALGLSERFEAVCANVSQVTSANLNHLHPDRNYQLAFFDPGRRDEQGKRIFKAEAYQPPLSTLKNWLSKDGPPHLKGLAVKVAPGIDYDELKQLGLDCEVEIISENGDVKEAVLWFAGLRNPEGTLSNVTRRATLLNGNTHISYDDSKGIPKLDCQKPRRYLHEPDGAIIRAGLVECLGAEIQAFKIDNEIAYLTSDSISNSPCARSFEIISSLPFSLKKIKEELQLLNARHLTVKKRGSPIVPEEFIKSLALKKGDGEDLTVILTRVKNEHTAFITRAI